MIRQVCALPHPRRVALGFLPTRCFAEKKSQNAIWRTVPDIYAREASPVPAFAYHLNFELHVGNVRYRYPSATAAFIASLP